MTAWWPAWLVAPTLGALTVGYWIALRRPLGVSGVLARFSRIREEREFDRGNEVLEADTATLAAAMAAATAEAFGAAADGGEPLHPEAPGAGAPQGRVCAPTPRLSAHAVFLVGIVAGGFLAALARGSLAAPLGALPGLGGGAATLGALALGGGLVGFGASLSGGCSAGHGLTGCGRLMPGSLVSTAVFFASAVGVSLLLAGRLA
jgi:hypothetical protein